MGDRPTTTRGRGAASVLLCDLVGACHFSSSLGQEIFEQLSSISFFFSAGLLSNAPDDPPPRGLTHSLGYHVSSISPPGQSPALCCWFW
jgi:hypothetical protein